VDSLALKLLLTPALIGAASLAGRRWGPAVSGWFVGLPLTSAPVVFFVALDQGSAFAHTAAIGTLAGTLSQAAFCLAYSWLGSRWRLVPTLFTSTLCFGIATAVLHSLSIPLVVLFFLVMAVLGIALRLMPHRLAVAASERRWPAWDLPARMILATAIVLGLTAAAPALGPHLTGLLAPFPLYAAILATFAHHFSGQTSAIEVLRGLLHGLFAFASFFLVVASLIEQTGISVAFVAAVAVTLAVQGASLWILHRRRT